MSWKRRRLVISSSLLSERNDDNGMEWHGMAWNGMEWHGMAWNGMEWHEMAWNGMEWHGMAWIICHGTIIWYILSKHVLTRYGMLHHGMQVL
jgi:hypothetical protein